MSINLFRPFTSFLAALATFIGAFIGGGYDMNYVLAFLASLVTFIFCMGDFALNDYFDRAIDKINHPERPLPAGKISSRNAFMLAIIFLSISPIIAFFINIECLLITLIALLLTILYEAWLKKKAAGNLIIAAQVSLTFLLGAAAVGGVSKAVFISLLSFLFIWGREIILDIEDVRGDSDRKTLPMLLGIDKAKILATFLMAIAIIMSPLPYILGMFNIYYIFFGAFACLIFIYSIMLIDRDVKKVREITKYGMLLSLIAFIVGTF